MASYINNLDQISGLPVVRLIGSAISRPYNILLLGDGFSDSDKKKYDDVCSQFVTWFFLTSPLKYCRAGINVFSLFTPSKTSGIPPENPPSSDTFNTVFRLFYTDVEIKSYDFSRIIDVIERVSMGTCFPGISINAKDIWLYGSSKSHGAIILLANTDAVHGAQNHGKYSIVPLSGFCPKDTPQPPGTYFGEFINIITHELGHSWGLDDEYERNTGDAVAEKPESPTVNIAYPAKPIDPSKIVGELPWKDLLTVEERRGHEDASLIVGKKSYTTDNWPHLTHPDTGAPVHWSQIYLIEGAGEYIRGVYRSNFDCKMRLDTYSKRLNSFLDPEMYSLEIQGRKHYGTPDFCRVCQSRIRKVIYGYDNFAAGDPDRNRLETLFREEIMPRIEKSLKLKDSTMTVIGPHCESASIRGYIMLRQPPFSVNVLLMITRNHVSLFFNGITLDPTFYDFYRMTSTPWIYSDDPNEDSVISFLDLYGVQRFFKNKEVLGGFIGSKDELIRYLLTYRPRKGSIMNNLFEWTGTFFGESVGDESMVEKEINNNVLSLYNQFYNSASLWDGPYGKCTVDYTPCGDYGIVIKPLWDDWTKYWDSGKGGKKRTGPDYIKPLDMSLSLKYVLSL